MIRRKAGKVQSQFVSPSERAKKYETGRFQDLRLVVDVQFYGDSEQVGRVRTLILACTK